MHWNFWTNVSVNSELIRLLQVSRSQLFVPNLMRSNHVSYTQPHTLILPLSLFLSLTHPLVSLVPFHSGEQAHTHSFWDGEINIYPMQFTGKLQMYAVYNISVLKKKTEWINISIQEFQELFHFIIQSILKMMNTASNLSWGQTMTSFSMSFISTQARAEKKCRKEESLLFMFVDMLSACGD